jgi:DNA-binding response OmpR family regulator/predicted regulator of Ras-like GTPase activity (Roadblock/LC7/MglB family)
MKRLLIVTGDETFWDQLDAAVDSALAGFAIDRAFDGGMAQELLQESQPDLLVTDISLPDMDGFEFLALLSHHYPRVPVIVLSEVASMLLNLRLENMGSLRVIKNPVNLPRLAEIARKLLVYANDDRQAHGVSLGAFLHLVDMEVEDCRLRVVDKASRREGRLDLQSSRLFAATCGELRGQAAALEMLCWREVEIWFEPSGTLGTAEERQSGLDLSELVMAAVRLRLEQPPASQGPVSAAAAETAVPFSSTDILRQLIRLPRVQATLVVARDGFVVETAGAVGTADLDMVGASAGVMLHGVEGMVGALALSRAQGMTMEFDRATLLCWPVGEALLALVTNETSDAEALEGLHAEVRRHLPALTRMF